MKKTISKLIYLLTFLTIIFMGNIVLSQWSNTYATEISYALINNKTNTQLDEDLISKASFYGIHINFDENDENNETKVIKRTNNDINYSHKSKFWGVPQL